MINVRIFIFNRFLSKTNKNFLNNFHFIYPPRALYAYLFVLESSHHFTCCFSILRVYDANASDSYYEKVVIFIFVNICVISEYYMTKLRDVPNILSLKNYVDEKSNGLKFRPCFEFSWSFSNIEFIAPKVIKNQNVCTVGFRFIKNPNLKRSRAQHMNGMSKTIFPSWFRFPTNHTIMS